MNSLEHTCSFSADAAEGPTVTNSDIGRLLVTTAPDCPKTAASLLPIIQRLPLLFHFPGYPTACHLRSACWVVSCNEGRHAVTICAAVENEMQGSDLILAPTR